MPSVSRAVTVVGLVLLIGGIASGGWGVYQRAANTCESGYGVTITRLDENETADPTAEHVAYGNLSAVEQRIFREMLTAETTAMYQDATPLEGLTQKVVTYRGERYETGPLFVSDCVDEWRFYEIWGGVTALLGGVIVVATSGWRWLR